MPKELLGGRVSEVVPALTGHVERARGLVYVDYGGVLVRFVLTGGKT